MASAAHNCDICDLRHVTKPSVSWCSECDEGFCSDCGEHHKLAKATRHHKTMTIADYQKLPTYVMQIPQSCTKHDEKFLLYCKDHETPCCGKCVIEGHKGCTEVINLDDIVKNAKTSTSFQEIEETLAEVVDNIKEIQNLYRGNITTITENRKQIEKQIQDIRFKIDTHLNQIQKKLIDEIKKVENTEIKKVRQLVRKIEEKENGLTKYQNTIANIKHHASDLQTFMSIKQIEQNLAKEEEFIQSCVNADAVNTKVITLCFDESIETIMTSVKRFGEIVVEIKPTKAALRRNKKRQAQIVVPRLHAKSFENITALLQQTIKTTSQNVRGCCILPDGRFAFTCFARDMLIVIKASGVKDFEIQLPGAVDVANGTADNTVIVSSSNERNKTGLCIIDIQDRKIKKFIPFESSCYGLVESNGNVIFCTTSKLMMLNLQTESFTTISTTNTSSFSNVDTHGTNIYYTTGTSVMCFDIQGSIQWTIEDAIIHIRPVGISVDKEGFLYVLLVNSVVIISPCGKQSRTLLKLKGFSQALHYDKSRDVLLIAERTANGVLYRVNGL